MADKYLDKVYGISSPEENRDLYDAWSETYDDEVSGAGYATPARCAAALAEVLDPSDAPILDYGCGTGLSGMALAGLGYSTIDGMDVSGKMMETAAKRGVYRTLTRIAPDEPIPVKRGVYAAIAAVGVITTGAGPATLLDDLLELLGPGGFMVFSFNDHALADPAYEGRVKAQLASGNVRQVSRTYGDHLPGHDMRSAVYVLEKL